jgi:hypothetical protein
MIRMAVVRGFTRIYRLSLGLPFSRIRCAAWSRQGSGHMIYIVYIAVCLVGMTPKDCNHSNAVDWIAAPEPQQGLAACMIHGEEYVSQARLVIPGKTYPKVYCQPPTNIGKGNVG